MVRFVLLLGSLIAIALACAWADADFVTIPPAPSDGIYDPSARLDSQFRSELAEEIRDYRRRNEIGLWLAVYPETPPQGGEIFAQSLLNSWGRSDRDSGLVLYVPNDPKSPYGASGGDLAKQWGVARSSTMVSAAMRRARARKGDVRVIEKAVGGLYSDIRFLRENYNRQLEQAQRRGVADYNQRNRKRIIIMGAIGAAVIAAIAVTLFLLIRAGNGRKKSSGEMIFPSVQVSQRLGAPFSGGSGTVRSASVRRHRRRNSPDGG